MEHMSSAVDIEECCALIGGYHKKNNNKTGGRKDTIWDRIAHWFPLL